jgi:hypothetical protein
MGNQSRGWIETLSIDDAEGLWAKLFNLVSNHSSIRYMFGARRISRDQMQDMCADLTQDLFLRLHQKNRWQFYLQAGYTDSRIEHELYHIEVPNMVSSLLRDRYPESYRLVRRISTLLQTRQEFRYYPWTVHSSGESKSAGKACASRKLVLKMYGLKRWPIDKPAANKQSFRELIKGVAFRKREIRRTGRGSGSQIIISNNELTELIVEIFEAIDSPADVRTVRSLVLSKLAVEDSQFISMDAGMVATENAESELLKINFADQRATPEELLLEKEMAWEIDAKLTRLFERMNEAVRNKPRRYSKLLKVVWHCYLDPLSPTQSNVSNTIGVSASLVTYYRKIFDSVIQDLELGAGQHMLFSTEFSTRLAAIISEIEASQADQPGKPANNRSPVADKGRKSAVKVRTATASAAQAS